MDGAICAAALAATILVAEVTSVARKHLFRSPQGLI
jgi:hypothetical protein